MTAVERGLVIALIGVVAVGAFVIVGGVSAADLMNLTRPRNVINDNGVQVRVPLPEGHPVRLAPAVTVAGSGSYAFMDTGADGQPVRYDPCRPVAWVHATAGMPHGAEQLVHDAMAEIELRTGLDFEYEGVTDEVASFDRPLIQERYGERFAPVIVGWSTGDQSPELRGDVAGMAGSSSVPAAYGEQRFLAAGVVLMDSEDVAPLLNTGHTSGLVKAVIMHEIGHVVGLGHVDDTGEIMHHDNVSRKEWGPGDLAGLAIAGSGPCQDS